jgi:hypothetical protein
MSHRDSEDEDMNQPVEQKTIERGRALYDLGATTMFASKADPRFHYCL